MPLAEERPRPTLEPGGRILVFYIATFYIIPQKIRLSKDSLNNTCDVKFIYLNEENEDKEIFENITFCIGKQSKKIQQILITNSSELDVNYIKDKMSKSQLASEESKGLIGLALKHVFST